MWERSRQYFVEAPKNVLPVSGVPIAGIRKYAEFPSRASAERDLLNFIRSCMNAEMVYGCIIKAWWGEGKTDAYENFIKPELEKSGLLTYAVVATTVARIFEKRKREGLSDPVVWRAFLGALFESIWEEGKTQIAKADFLQRSENEVKSDLDYINRVMLEITKRTNKLFIFIDELEQLEILPLRDEILLGIRGLFDQKVLGGALHLIMACTPDAFNRLIGSSTQMGGLLERLTIIELPRPAEEEAVKFVFGLINFVYDGKLPEIHPFVNSGPAYAIMYAGHKSPRSMIKALQQVIEYAKSKASENGKKGYLQIIDGWTIVDAFKDYNLPIFGTQVRALDGDILDEIDRAISIKGEIERTQKMQKFMRLLIGEPIPHSLEELKSRMNLSEDKIKELVGIINNKVSETGLFNRLPIISLAESSAETPVELKEYSKCFIFYEDGDFVSRIFLPTREQSLISLFPGIEKIEAQRIIRRLLSYCGENYYYIISPEIIERLYPNPDFLELDFIKDKNKRLELWKEAYERISEDISLSYCEDSLLELFKEHIGA